MNGETDDLKKTKGFTWAEAAKVVLERSDRPMTHKEILRVIQNEDLRDVSKGSAPLACLNAMLHHNSRGPNDVFYKVNGRMSCYGLNLDRVEIPDDQLSEEEEMSEDTVEPFRSSDSDDEPLVYTKNGGSRAGSHHLSEERSKSGGVQGREESLPRKRGPRPRPNDHSATKRPRVSSRPCPVSKSVLKNLKVGSPSDGRSVGNTAVKKSSFQTLIAPVSNRNPVTGQFQSRSAVNLDMKAAQDIAKTQGLWMKKPRRYKKVSFAAQMKRTKEGRVDLQTPDSILVNIPLRTLINQRTYNLLPPAYQYQLLHALPKVDRYTGPDQISRPSHTCFNNEFFTSASQSWRDRLQEGEFMSDVQPNLKSDEIKVDPWKAKFFEPVWGQGTLPEEPDSPPLPDYMHCSELYGPDSHEYMDNNLDVRNTMSRGAGALMRALTVPVKRLPAHQFNRNTPRPKHAKVTASRRSEAARQLSRAYAQSKKVSPVVVINLVTPAIASSAVSAVRTEAPTNVTFSKSVCTGKRLIKPPCDTAASDNTAAIQSRDLPSPFGSTSPLLNELGLPCTPGIPRTISRTSMLKASRSNARQVSNNTSKAKLTSTNALTTPVTATVPLKNFGRSVLLRNCSCSLRAMLVCRSCGAFCHHDCISTTQLCGACVN